MRLSDKRVQYMLKILRKRRITIIKKHLKKVERFIRLIAKVTGLWQLELLFVPFIHFRSSSFEPKVEERIRERLRNGWTFVDVGASFGYYTVLAAIIMGPEGRVVSIEPAPKESYILSVMSKLYRLRNIFVMRVAAYSRNCRTKLYLSHLNGFHSLIKRNG